jgi:hypothetical protein
MKKITKPSKTPAPATKLAAPVPVARKSTVAPKIKPAATGSPTVVAKAKGARVTIIAVIDVGFGNSLSVRGDEPFFNWNKGALLGCVAADRWEIVLTGVDRPFQFKFLVNDASWSTGDNYTASPGDTLTLTPAF